MKRFTKLIIIALCLLPIVLNSCDAKKEAIEDLRNLRTEIRLHGEEYDKEDWVCAENDLSLIHERLEEYELTPSEEKLVSNIDSEIHQYKVRYNPEYLLGDIATNVAGVIDELAGTNTTENVEALAQSAIGIQSHVEKQVKRTFWTYAAWVGGGIIASGLFSFIVILVRNSKTSSRRRTRVRNSTRHLRR